MRIFAAVAAVVFSIAAGFVRGEAPAGRPNLLLVTIDTLRPDRLGCYGSRTVATPAIDRLAGRGVLFERAFSPAPLTLPAHASILLGLYPRTHGVHDNANFRVPDGLLTLAEWLKQQGYETGAVVGAFPLDSRFGLTRGFDLYDDSFGSQGVTEMTFVERNASAVADRAMAWIKERPGPWFLWAHFFDPHQKYQPPEPFMARYKDSPYDGEVAYVDSELERLLGALSGPGGADGTVTVFTADHGESLGDHGETTHGYFAYNATIHVPLIIAGPGLGPRRVRGNASLVDLFPTVCDALGVGTPPRLEGVSLWPSARGKDAPLRPIGFEALMPYYTRGWAPLEGYIEGDVKYMDSPIPEVYDLAGDFQELQNTAGDANLGACRKRFVEWTKSLSGRSSKAESGKTDRETREKLESLGYTAGPRPPARKAFTKKDDLKVLLPFQEKWGRAISAYEAGRPDESIRLLKEVITDRPDFELATTYLANFYKGRGRLADAVTVLEVAAAANPESYTLGTAYGAMLVEAGRNDEAVMIIDKALTLIDFDPEAWNCKGIALRAKGDTAGAMAAFGKAIELDDNNAIVFNNIGSLHLSAFLKSRNAGSFVKAEEGFRRAIALDPKYASAYNGLGAVLKMGGDMDGAVDAWKKAVELRPGFAFPLYNLGLAFQASGDKAQALAYFRRYKDAAYAGLPAEEKTKLDELIASCEEYP